MQIWVQLRCFEFSSDLAGCMGSMRAFTSGVEINSRDYNLTRIYSATTAMYEFHCARMPCTCDALRWAIAMELPAELPSIRGWRRRLYFFRDRTESKVEMKALTSSTTEMMGSARTLETNGRLCNQLTSVIVNHAHSHYPFSGVDPQYLLYQSPGVEMAVLEAKCRDLLHCLD